MIETKIVGLEALQLAFKELPVELHKTSLTPAVAAATRVVQQAARALVPVASGSLRRGVYRGRWKKESNRVQVTYVVGVRHGKTRKKNKTRKDGSIDDPFYWYFVEFGTKNMPAKPFMRPAFESTKGQQLEVMGRHLRTGLARAAEKLARRAGRGLVR